ncbi:MAG TPA: hypothetical protein VFO74_15390 [Pseudolabrys sp.]|nr:hypothetical protein [Pseudolabrys sp.]
MWAITSYFNPVGFKRRLSNYRIFRANLAVPLVTVELSFDGRFELTDDDADILIQLSGGAVLWQKERLLNIAIKSVPENAKNIAWLDCDVIFERPDWMHEAERKLSEANVVQLYSELVDLGPEGYRSSIQYVPPSGHGIVSLGLKQQNAPTEGDVRFSLPGLAWAARREILEEHGFYDAMIIGSGDSSIFHAMHGRFDHELGRRLLTKAHEEHYLMWARPYHRTVRGKVSNVAGRICHLYHGKFVNRRYRSRHDLLAGLGFDPDLDLRIGANGAWHWARPRPDLEDFLQKYFLSRAEDDQ